MIRVAAIVVFSLLPVLLSGCAAGGRAEDGTAEGGHLTVNVNGLQPNAGAQTGGGMVKGPCMHQIPCQHMTPFGPAHPFDTVHPFDWYPAGSQ